MQQEACEKVYFTRIQRGKEAYSAGKLGAFGSDLGGVACFFETPWSRVSAALTQADQAWLLNQASFRLRALGRLTEALEPMRAGLENYGRHEDWTNAAITASNLSELELTLGEVAGAVRDADQSVSHADRSDDAFWKMGTRTTHADAQYLPHGLLTRAWLRSLEDRRTGPESAQGDLDEAWEIAERGPMKLHMPDIHLHRARLLFRETQYPWGSPAADLAAAEKLIDDCGYHRRDEELEDARRAISGGGA